MSTNDQAGAVAAAQYFAVDLYNYVHASLDLTEWRAMSDPACTFCNSVSSDVETLVKPLTFDTSSTHVVSAAGTTITDGSRYTATIVVEQPQGDGEDTPTVYEFYFAIAWADGWQMLAVDVTPIDQ